ncbi:FecCD family ABC transporter permease [Gordonia sp. MP11Mi]|uniref:Ferric enterobactin transport system permease protein FepD n=1 Tax=Gordonia sp. MP11Mi TaxID=3022769 RepID=A0AA97GW49_9ACTN
MSDTTTIGSPVAVAVAEDPSGSTAAAVARRLSGLVAAAAVLVVCIGLSLAIGSKSIPLDDVWHGLFDASGTPNDFVIRDYRIPRTVIAGVVGIALGVAGALIQALTRNPLADPGILGVNAGAALFVVVGSTVFGIGAIGTSVWFNPVWFAFAGALVVTVAVYLIGSAGRGPADPTRLTLAGVAVGAVLTGITTALTLVNTEAFDTIRTWNAGSLVGRGFDVLVPVLPFFVLGLVLASVAARPLNAIALGEDFAAALGAPVIRTRIVVVIAVTLLAGGATAVAGPIGFVGLMVPHIARWIVGPDQRWILAYTCVLAPIMVIASDVLGRVVMRPGEIPVGIVTAFVGAPVLIVLIRRRKASGL